MGFFWDEFGFFICSKYIGRIGMYYIFEVLDVKCCIKVVLLDYIVDKLDI